MADEAAARLAVKLMEFRSGLPDPEREPFDALLATADAAVTALDDEEDVGGFSLSGSLTSLLGQSYVQVNSDTTYWANRIAQMNDLKRALRDLN